MMNEKETKWLFKIVFSIVGIISLFNIVPYFTRMLRALILLYEMTDTSPEFKLILLAISLWITCSIFNVITNIVFKIYEVLDHEPKQRGMK